MRKEWLHWIVGREKSSRRRVRDNKMEEASAAATSAGCMCAVFQLFDLHHFQLPLNQHHHYLHEEEEAVATSKGVEAPRNSLEIEESVANEVGSKSLAMKDEEKLNFPVGMHIKTGHEKISSSPRISTNSLFSKLTIADDISSSETKTPTLVARLMGLDLLPDQSNSPSFSNSNPQKTPPHSNYQTKNRNILQTRSSKTFSDDDISIGARSLPETPRISSARRSDVDYYHHHRLSLQVNKENRNEEFGGSKKRRGKFKAEDENRSSPGHYAKQIVKQVKESVSRRVGLMDITNTKDNNKHELKSTRRDENLILHKPTKKNGELSPDGKQSMTPSCSPRLRFLETNKPKQIPTKSPRNSVPFSDNNPSKPNSQVITPLQENQKISKKLPPKVSEQAIRNNNKESFIRSKVTNKESLAEIKKAKKASLSSEILSISPTLLPVKKGPSPPATKLPQKQSQVSDAVSSKRRSQLSCCNPAHPYLQLPPDQIFAGPEKVLTVNTNSCATAPHGGAAAEYENYIKRILKRVGITDRATPITVAKWHAPSHPLDPSIFHYLELFHPFLAASGGDAGDGENSILSCRSNRKLIFQLVDEILAETLRPHLYFKPWVSPVTVNRHLPLVDELCQQILRFPAANCQVLEDIDALVDADFRKFKANGLMLEEDWESVVRDIEGQIVESLLLETVAVVGGRSAEEQRHRLTDVTWEPLT